MTQQQTAARYLAALLGLTLWATGPAHAQYTAVADGIPAGDPEVAARLEGYVEAREASFLDWLPDDSILVATRFGTQTQVHRVAAPLGMREQLTYFPGPVREVTAPRACCSGPPRTGDATGFAFTRDTGDGQPQLYWYSLKARHAQMLSGGTFTHGSPVWSKDGRRVAFFGTERGPQAFDIYVSDLSAGTPPQLLIGSNGRAWEPLDWSADGRLLLWQPADGTLYLADTATGIVTPVDPTGQLRGVRSARFAPDGHGVYFIASASVGKPAQGGNDAGGDFEQLRLLDLTTHQARDITTGSWDVEDFDASADGRYLAYVTNENGRSRLTVLDTLHRLELRPAGLPDGLIRHPRFNGSGHKLAFSAESPLVPRDVYVFEPETNTLTRWTRSEPGPLDPGSFTDARAVQFPTWDSGSSGRRQIPAFVYRARAQGQHPVLVIIHDGPDAQARPGFDGFIQFAINELGYTVITPNIRGSTGYGRGFSQLDDGALRGDALRDLGALLVWIGQQPGMDRSHVVVMGQSFGGLMALDALAAWGDRLQGGIDIGGVTSIPDYLKAASPDQQARLRAELGNEYDTRTRAVQNRLSPNENLPQIRRPLLVVQGLNDTPTQVNQSGQLVASLRARGIEAWLLQLRGEGHAIRSSAGREAWWQAAAQFLKKLKDAPGTK